MLLQGLADIVFELTVGREHAAVHLDVDQPFFIRRKLTGDIFEEHERAQLHQMFAEQ